MSALKDLIFPSTLKRWGVQNLDYNWYFALTIFGGFLGLDYMYLGSPLTGIVKAIVNMSTFGFWWYFDALNAALSQDQVRLYGPSAPAVGVTGIAGGRFRDAKNPDGSKDILDKHFRFFIYGLVLIFGGLFGIDHFATGDMMAGFMNLICTVSIIGFPVSFVWYIYKLYRYYLNSSDCIDANWEYFGAPQPSENPCPSVLMVFTVWIVKTGLAVLRLVPLPIGPIISLGEMLLSNLQSAYGFVAKTVPEVMKETTKLVETERGRPIPIGIQGTAPPALEQTGGGMETDLLAPFFALTIVLVIVSSLVLSLRRLRQNGSKQTETTTVKQFGSEATDDPPKPANPGVPTSVY
jgi:TM2 domain-containing membrane protein YozV